MRASRELVADEMTRARQRREQANQPELSAEDERQFGLSVISAAVQRHQSAVLAGGGELPADTGYDMRFMMAIDQPCTERGIAGSAG